MMKEREDRKQEEQQLQWQKKMQTRPTQQQLVDRNILVDKNEVREHRRRASKNLTNSLSQRPTFSDLVERGILRDDNQQFDQRMVELLGLVDGSLSTANPDRHKIHAISEDLKQDYLSVISRLNGQLSEYKQTLNQFQDDVHSREQRWRLEIENKQRVLLHMHGICDQQKADEQALRSEYEEKIREIHAEYKERNDKNKGFDRMRGGSTNNHQVLEVRKSLQMLQKLADALHSELSQKYDSSPNQ